MVKTGGKKTLQLIY